MTTTRMPCLKCKVSMHPDTAQRNGGLCMPCSGSLSPRAAARREAFVAAFATSEASARQQRATEECTLETADWIGRAGLDEAADRELPRSLRREWVETLGEPGALTASDLQYLGRFATGALRRTSGACPRAVPAASRRSPTWRTMAKAGPRSMGRATAHLSARYERSSDGCME